MKPQNTQATKRAATQYASIVPNPPTPCPLPRGQPVGQLPFTFHIFYRQTRRPHFYVTVCVCVCMCVPNPFPKQNMLASTRYPHHQPPGLSYPAA